MPANVLCDGVPWLTETSPSESLEYNAAKAARGESHAAALPAHAFADPDRTIETHAATLGLGSSPQSYLDLARAQPRLNYDARLGAPPINNYIRAGFGP
jgi:hypothetical protein